MTPDNPSSNGRARAENRNRFIVELTTSQVEALNRNRMGAGRKVMTREEMMQAMVQVHGFAQSVRLAIEVGLVPGRDKCGK